MIRRKPAPPPPAPAPVINPLAPTAADWTTVYNGYGSVNYDADGVEFAPKAATQPSETHAALLTKNNCSLRNFQATFGVTVEQQLRTGSLPNAWECFWPFFNYRIGADGKKECNYFILKPNGVELGRCFGSVGQEFLATMSLPKLSIGLRSSIFIKKIGTSVSFSVNGSNIVTVNNSKFLDVAGTIGLYSEDAKVRVHSVKIEPLP